MEQLAYLQSEPQQQAILKQECADFWVIENLGYSLSGEGEFVALRVRKTDCNTLFVGEKLAAFAGIPARNMSYAGLKDRKGITEQWFCLQMPGKATPDFSQFCLAGVEILEVTRHQRKIRIGSLEGNAFQILLRNLSYSEDLENRLHTMVRIGFPNYFTEQRFGRDGHNLTQAMRWATGEIKVKDRNKRRFYLSAARSEVFNRLLSERIKEGVAQQVLHGDILQLAGSHSWFRVEREEELEGLQQRLDKHDLLLTGPLIGEGGENCTSAFERDMLEDYAALNRLMAREGVSPARRPLIIRPQQLEWRFEAEGLRLNFYLPAGSYATALIRELVQTKEAAPMVKGADSNG
ncbi:tRNA pseudouridine13 synthase [Mesocricetibacter intestinalis]|uniref:tRNA pseudouridine synthase D n=1 Tax=Mesocricetibacter intestinalis TaxID=1521930 RepID=A0A4R6VB12_9PAST|nr:tRNA pseudouridine(13) synthase TruD [Mesocricetibacter intestinalis]TDQ56667.1 tRNA pseudouridine13 synthase [Mesocricetibacter intestinalis]